MKYRTFIFNILILATLIISQVYSQQWKQLPGSAVDISIGADGSLWIVGTGGEKLGNYLLKYNFENQEWEKSPTGLGIKISVDPKGRPWIINKKGKIFRKKGKNWQELPGSATDICANQPAAVYIAGTDERDLGYSIFKWNKLPLLCCF